MSKLSKMLIVLLLSFQILVASSLEVEKGWNLVSNFDSEQNVSCLLEKLERPSFVWAYDNLQKKWQVLSNDSRSNLKIINIGINSIITIEPYRSFWIYGANKVNIDFDCNTSLHVDINKTKKLNAGWNLVSNVDTNQSTFLLLGELNSTSLIFAYDNVNKKWFAKANDLNTSRNLAKYNIPQIDTLFPYQAFWIYNDDTINIDFNASKQYTQMLYEKGDLKDYNLTNLHTSFKETTGAVVQAILAINSMIYTDINETNITQFQDRKDQAIQALDYLIELSSQTESFADELPDSAEVGRLLRTTATPQEIYAIINDSKIKGHIKTLMQRFNVGAHQAKKILDDAMSTLENKYSNDADFYTKAIVISQAVRDTSALTVTIGSTILTAGTATTAVGAALEVGGTIISGTDAVIKATKSLAELYIGQDGALDGTIKNSMILKGVSDINAIISIKDLFSNPSGDKAEKVFSLIGKYSWATDKVRDLFYDKKIIIGEEEISFADADENEQNSTKQELNSVLVPKTFIGNFEVNTSKICTSLDSDILETNVTKVLNLNNIKIIEGNTTKIVVQTMPKVIEKILSKIPKDKRIKATKEIVEKSWEGWPEPQWCPKENWEKRGYIISIWLDNNKGIATCSYDTYGDLEYEYLKVNNKRNGIKKYYYKFSGKLKEEMPYVDGLLNGNIIEYYEDGTIEEIFPYVFGKREGVYKYFYETGILHREVIYEQDIKIVEKWYKSNGCLYLKNIYDSEHYEAIDTIYYDCSE